MSRPQFFAHFIRPQAFCGRILYPYLHGKM